MRGVVFSRFGEPADVLSVEAQPEPVPQAGEVLVRMLASPINPSDLMTIRGIYGKRPALPFTPGYEGVGVVTASRGGLIGSFLKGKRVAVLNSPVGNWREWATTSAKSVIPVPAGLTDEQAAMFFVNPATAYLLTRKVLAVPRGAWLLQSAAGSAVGRMVIRLGKQHGFRTFNLVRRAEQAADLQALGADMVHVFDAASPTAAAELRDRVDEVCGTDGVRHAIDPVGGATGSAIIGCLGGGGRLIVYGTLSPEPLVFSSRVLMTHGARVESFWLSRYMADQSLLGKLKIVGELTKGLKSGVLASEVGEVFPLDQVQAAVRAAEAPGRAGKIVLRLST